MTMPEPLTDERLAELERLCAEATPGPWRVRHLCSGCGPDEDEGAGLGLEIEGPPQPWHEGQFSRAADAQFIAAARDALPALITALRALRRVAADAGLLADGILGGHTCDIQPCRRCGIERASATLQPCVVCRGADVRDALAEWRRVRGE